MRHTITTTLRIEQSKYVCNNILIILINHSHTLINLMVL